MNKCIYGTPVGGSALPKSYVLETEDGITLTGVLVGEETVMTATANDIRQGKIAATENGIIMGEKIIPSYHTTEAFRYIPDGSAFTLPLSSLDKYDYTKLQVIICAFNTSMTDSVAAEKVSILDKVYDVGSTVELANVIKDSDNKQIDLGIVNNSGHPCVLRFITYKEID